MAPKTHDPQRVFPGKFPDISQSRSTYPMIARMSEMVCLEDKFLFPGQLFDI
ncbi:MAG: hypothetical protein WCO44_04345 [Bacteroidota bacterium]